MCVGFQYKIYFFRTPTPSSEEVNTVKSTAEASMAIAGLPDMVRDGLLQTTDHQNNPTDLDRKLSNLCILELHFS